MGRHMQVWYEKNRNFWPVSRCVVNKMGVAIATVEHQQKLVCDLSNGTTSSDLEWTLTQTVSMARHYSMMNISETIQGTQGIWNSTHAPLNVVILNDFKWLSKISNVARPLCDSWLLVMITQNDRFACNWKFQLLTREVNNYKVNPLETWLPSIQWPMSKTNNVSLFYVMG